MKLELFREVFNEASTIGKLSIDGVFECFTLEDKVREPFVKIAGQTAIQPGTYNVIVSMSNRFHRMLPLLVNVPHFEGIRIHPGNTQADTEGCILVGREMSPTRDSILSSRLAFDALFKKIDLEYSRGQKIEIEIIHKQGG